MLGLVAMRALWVVLVGAGEGEPAQAEPADMSAPRVEMTDQGISVWRPAVVLDGSLLAVEVVAGGCEPSVRWGGGRFTAYPMGLRVTVPGSQHSHPPERLLRRHALLPVALGARGERQLRVRCGEREAVFSVPIVEGTYAESKLSVDPRFTQKPPGRVVSERAAIKAALAVQTTGRLWSASFLRPGGGVETSLFGVRRTYNGRLDSRHRGLDIDGKLGDEVMAANDGVVVLAAPDFYYTGNAVFIDHGDELFTLYFHLSRLDVKSGDRVERGQVIGAVGNTGRVTGPHLHFAVKLSDVYVDPKGLLAYQPDVLPPVTVR